MKPNQTYTSPHQGNYYSQPRRRNVITGRTSAQPAFSSEGVRWDVWIVILSLAVLLFGAILLADIEAVHAGDSRLGQLSAGIEDLMDTNSLLQEKIDLRMAHPVLSHLNGQAEAGEETVITITAAPLS